MSVKISRRNFLMGCSAAIAAMAGSRITNLAFAAGGAPETLIVLFLRGGWDGLNVVSPIGDLPGHSGDRGIYEAERPTLRVPTGGTGAALNLNGYFGLHPSLSPLLGLYQSQKLAIIHAAGLVFDTRSHFDAMQFMELGTPGVKTIGTGWLSRYLQSLSLTAALPALSAGSGRAAALMGYGDAVAMSRSTNLNNSVSFDLGGNSAYRGQQTMALRNMYGSNADWLDQAGAETIATVDLIQSRGLGGYVPSNGAQYPTQNNSTNLTGFAANLALIAQMIKAGVGLSAATIDLGGWDTHENQGDSTSGTYMSTLLNELGRALLAFYTDLSGSGCNDYMARTTVVVMSEFGRRIKENASRGTDHGHGNVMFVMGGQVKGGQVYGNWPGLAPAQRYQNADLAITTDYRRVLSEILNRRMYRNATHLGSIFPNYTQEAPLNFMFDNGGGVPPPPPVPPTGPNFIYLPLVNRAGQCP
jgi:uncharacterized protein (DUF1501 family)